MLHILIPPFFKQVRLPSLYLQETQLFIKNHVEDNLVAQDIWFWPQLKNKRTEDLESLNDLPQPIYQIHGNTCLMSEISRNEFTMSPFNHSYNI